MPVTVRSFAKINICLRIGPRREDGYHELRTLYQTIGLYDLIRIDACRGSGIEIECNDARVPTEESNTCWRVADRVLRALKIRSKVRIAIQKRLPMQGGLGAASSNAIAVMLGLERALKRKLAPQDRLRIAAEVGSDLPLFLIGGTVLGVGRGEQVYAMEDLPGLHCVVATPSVGVSTPTAFAEWDKKLEQPFKLTGPAPSDRMSTFSQSLYGWLSGSRFSPTGVPSRRWDRAEALLLDLVRTGIENDFESVVFPMYPAVRQVKSMLEREGAKCASLSGSGSSVYGLFGTRQQAANAARRLTENGIAAQATMTLPRTQYWKRLFPGKL
ncbi:MAG TPA: 4-(cytidine 5'-diphospho)-2-C-methyl-D-erythritol kinase [Verrucomicrobiae bacterium]|jgi:4-diphosphocytidyl-2-C-methyl-D-erythritol kinase|nr:4-(cytidine 5'-diphospho)-2-C-methyl-D-erythritol kinase [Verrucomicrobiae bacterium]